MVVRVDCWTNDRYIQPWRDITNIGIYSPLSRRNTRPGVGALVFCSNQPVGQPVLLYQLRCIKSSVWEFSQCMQWWTVSWFFLLTIATLSFCWCINLHNLTDHKLCRTPLLVSCACGVSKFDHIRQHITDCGYTGCQYISVSSSLRCVC